MLKYNLSITTGGLFVPEAVTILKAYNENRSWENVQGKVENENLLQKTHVRSAKNILYDLKRRLQHAYPWEVEAVIQSEDPEEWGFVCMAFTARKYKLLRDVLINVIYYKWQSGDIFLDNFEIPEYVNTLAYDHPEIENLSPRTREDLMQILKRDIRDGGLLVKHQGNVFKIVKPGIGARLQGLYENEGSVDDLRFLLLNDNEIKKIKGVSA